MTVEFERQCRHGMPREWCADCLDEEALARMPNPIDDEEVLGPVIEKTPSLRKSDDNFTVLGKKDDPSSLPMTTRLIHIGQSPSEALIEEVTRMCPFLQIIRFPADLYERHIKQNTNIARLLKERGIQPISGEARPIGPGKVWRKKRKFLLNLDSYQEGVLENADRLGLPEARIVKEYFCPEEPRPEKSLAQVSSENGLTLANARVRISGLLGFLGYPIKGKSAREKARRFEKRYRRSLKKERRRQKRARCSEFQEVPKNMPIHLWEQFLIFTRARARETDEYRSLPYRTKSILCCHYGLLDGIYRTAEEVSEILNLGLTRSGITYIEKQALKRLEAEKKEKKRKVKKARARVEPGKHCIHGMSEEWCADCNPPKEPPSRDLEILFENLKELKRKKDVY